MMLMRPKLLVQSLYNRQVSHRESFFVCTSNQVQLSSKFVIGHKGTQVREGKFLMRNYLPQKVAEVSNPVNLTSHNMTDCGLLSPIFVLEGVCVGFFLM